MPRRRHRDTDPHPQRLRLDRQEHAEDTRFGQNLQRLVCGQLARLDSSPEVSRYQQASICAVIGWWVKAGACDAVVGLAAAGVALSSGAILVLGLLAGLWSVQRILRIDPVEAVREGGGL